MAAPAAEACGGLPGVELTISDQTDIAERRITERTRRTYDVLWRRFGVQEVEDGWEKDSYQYDALIPPELIAAPGTLTLDAGCGGGADLVRFAARGGRLIGLDLSDGVQVAARLTRGLDNVRIVQGDVRRPPFAHGTFDRIYSFGVLHHLPDPEAALRGLAELLKPGGCLVTYLYEDFSDRSRPERALLGLVRAVTSRLPRPVLLVGCWLAAPLVWLTCSVPARLLCGPAPQLAGRIPFRHTLRVPVLASDLFDRFAPPIERRYSTEGVRKLHEAAGLERIRIRRHRGWVSWGFVPKETIR